MLRARICADAHPRLYSVTADGEKRRYWANPALWVTCAYGLYNFEFMTSVHKEIMECYQPDGIFLKPLVRPWDMLLRTLQEELHVGLRSRSAPDRAKSLTRSISNGRIGALSVCGSYGSYGMPEVRKINGLSPALFPMAFPTNWRPANMPISFFADQQARTGAIPPHGPTQWALPRASCRFGDEALVNIFSVGAEEEWRWKDSV